MMNKQTLTLDRPAAYQICVPGHLDEGWSLWEGEIALTAVIGGDDPPTTILTGAMDQAALQGLLRRLYALGLPLISVTCIEST